MTGAVDSPAAGPIAETRPNSAGAIRRLLATLLDMVVFCGLSAVLALPLTEPLELGDPQAFLDTVASTVSDPSWLSHASGTLGMWMALWWIYFAVGWGLLGATPGKWMLGLRLIDHRSRCPIGVSRALLRMVAYVVSSSTFGLGHALIMLRDDRRALHDILAGTRVVRRKDLPRSE